MKTQPKLKWTPTLDHIVVDVDKAPKSAIVLPDSSKAERPPVGTVVAVGPGYPLGDGKLMPMKVKRGDRVMLDRARGKPIDWDGEEMIILREVEVLAVGKRRA